MSLLNIVKLSCFHILLFLISTVHAQDSMKVKGPGFYTILSEKKDPIRIPFTMQDGKPLLEVEMNGIPAKLMIDNGVLWDEIWLFGSPLVQKLNLKPLEESAVSGAGEGEPTAAYIAENQTIKFDDIIFYEQPILVSPPEAGFARMFPGADGQLCNTIFKHFIVEFDFISNTLILHNPEHFEYAGKGSILPMKENSSGTHAVPFRFVLPDGKAYSDWVDIDFGGIYALKIALENNQNIPLPNDVTKTYSYGAQGKISEYKGKIKSMTIGKYTFQSPAAIFGNAATSRIHPENLGVIGLPLFQRFNIIFDYINNKLYIEPNANFSQAIE